jgi:hypothetical protein
MFFMANCVFFASRRHDFGLIVSKFKPAPNKSISKPQTIPEPTSSFIIPCLPRRIAVVHLFLCSFGSSVRYSPPTYRLISLSRSLSLRHSLFLVHLFDILNECGGARKPVSTTFHFHRIVTRVPITLFPALLYCLVHHALWR